MVGGRRVLGVEGMRAVWRGGEPAIALPRGTEAANAFEGTRRCPLVLSKSGAGARVGWRDDVPEGTDLYRGTDWKVPDLRFEGGDIEVSGVVV